MFEQSLFRSNPKWSKVTPAGLGQVSHLVWALAWSGDRDVDQFGNSDNGDTGVQDDAKI